MEVKINGKRYEKVQNDSEFTCENCCFYKVIDEGESECTCKSDEPDSFCWGMGDNEGKNYVFNEITE